MRTRIVLKEKDLDFDRILIDLPNKEQKQAWFLALNPYGKVPVLVEENAWVYESAICNEYLEDAYPTPALTPTSPGDRARMRVLIEMCNSQFVPPVIRLLYTSRKPKAEQDPARMARNTDQLAGLFPQLEAQLADRDYLMGAYSLADLTFTPFLTLCEHLGVDMTPYPKVVAWHERQKNRPSYEEVRIGLTG